MANPHRGDVSLKVGERTYTMRFSANAICVLEEQLNRGVVSIANEMVAWAKDAELIRLSTIRAVLWASLQDHHPDVDLKAAGELVFDAGGIVVVAEKISETLTRAFPDAETKGARPPRKAAADGTGPSS